MGEMGLLGITAPGIWAERRETGFVWDLGWAAVVHAVLVFSGVRGNRAGVPGARHCDGGDVPRLCSHSSKLRSPLQPLCQSAGSPWQRGTEGEVYA